MSQCSIVRFLQCSMEYENLIILLTIRSLSFIADWSLSLVFFAMKERDRWPCFSGKLKLVCSDLRVPQMLNPNYNVVPLHTVCVQLLLVSANKHLEMRIFEQSAII